MKQGLRISKGKPSDDGVAFARYGRQSVDRTAGWLSKVTHPSAFVSWEASGSRRLKAGAWGETGGDRGISQVYWFRQVCELPLVFRGKGGLINGRIFISGVREN